MKRKNEDTSECDCKKVAKIDKKSSVLETDPFRAWQRRLQTVHDETKRRAIGVAFTYANTDLPSWHRHLCTVESDMEIVQWDTTSLQCESIKWARTKQIARTKTTTQQKRIHKGIR